MGTAGTLHVACAADERYAPHCAAMLHSALFHSGGRHVAIHFMHRAGLNPMVIERLRHLADAGGAEFDPITIEDRMVQGLAGTQRISLEAWYRSLLPGLRPDLNRVLYLDCDVLVTDALGPLWETDIGDCYAAAVQNVFEPVHRTRHHALGVPPGQVYFNSGVLLMNLSRMREDGCAQQILEHGRRHGPRLIWAEQDSVNAVLGRSCRLLHPRWNCQNSLFYWRRAEEVFGRERVAEATREPAIVHFEGPGLAKPWNYLCKHPYRGHYYFHLAHTPWRGMPPEDLDWTNRLLRLLPMRITPEILSLARRVERVLKRIWGRLTYRQSL